MKNPLTFQVESYLGAGFVVLFAGFCVSLIFVALKNFDSEIEIMGAQETHIRTISPTERSNMESWIRVNSINIPEGEGYRWLIRTYPSRPWNM